jgi:hypothetical protein
MDSWVGPYSWTIQDLVAAGRVRLSAGIPLLTNGRAFFRDGNVGWPRLRHIIVKVRRDGHVIYRLGKPMTCREEVLKAAQ